MRRHQRLTNALRRVVTLYPRDPWEAQVHGIQDAAAVGLQSYSGTPYAGDKGDPSRTWNGPLRTSRGAQITAGRLLGSNPNTYGDTPSRNLSNANSDALADDPTSRIFAARLARRQR